MISIICCYNNQKVLNNMLLKSLQNQDADYELILVDNTNNRFKSAAEALNDGAKKSSGDFLMFVHQDVEIYDKYFLKKFIDEIYDEEQIFGIAGVKDNSGVYTNIRHGKGKKYAGKNQITNKEKVQTLDEVLIFIRKSTFEKLFFDEKTCDDWHLYGVDLCLKASSLGIDSYVLPANIYHLSTGKISKGYRETLIKLARKHSSNHKKIITTCSIIETSNMGIIKYKIKELINQFR